MVVEKSLMERKKLVWKMLFGAVSYTHLDVYKRQVLLYLMRNSFIEADFDEIFGVKLNKIVRKIDEMKELHSEKETFHYIRIALSLIHI